MKTGLKEVSQDRRINYYRTQVRKHGQRYANFHWPSTEILLSLIHTRDRINDIMESLFNKYGLSSASFNALMILSRSQPHGCIQQELSQLLLVSRANITGILNGLVRQELASRNAHPEDRRAHIVKISSKGEYLLNALLPEYHQEVFDVMSGLSGFEKKSFKKLLTQLQLGIQRNKKFN